MTATVRPLDDPVRLADVHAAGRAATAGGEQLLRMSSLAARLLQVDFGFISLVGEDVELLTAVTGRRGGGLPAELPVALSVCRHLVLSGEPLLVADLRQHPGLSQLAEVQALGLQSYAGTPLTSRDGSVLGGLCVGHSTARPWSPAEAALLADLASAVESELQQRVALEALARAEQAERRRAEQQSALHRVARLVASGAPPTRVLAQVAEELAGLLEVTAALVLEFRTDGEVATLAEAGLPTDAPQIPLPAAEPVADGLVAHGLVAHGLVAHGLVAHGLVADGLAADPLVVDGPMADGSVASSVPTLTTTAPVPAVLPRLPGAAQVLTQVRETGKPALVAWDGASFAAVPVTVEGVSWGAVLALTAPTTSTDTLGQLEALTDFIGLVMANTAAQQQLQLLARTDALTGTANRRAFEERLAEELQRAARYGHPVGLLLLDLDDFKGVNDGHGHEHGDRVLCELAARVEAQLRDLDLLARLGGDEFAVLLPETDQDRALVVAERVRHAVGTELLVGQQVTLSLGVAVADDGLTTAAELYRTADTALYEAKRAGRNRVGVAPAR